MLSNKYIEEYKDVQSFKAYLNSTIISNIDLNNDYLNAEKKSQNEKNDIIEIEYVINAYGKDEYIKLFNYESNQKPKPIFSYYVLLIEDSNGYSLEIYK